VIGFKGRRFEKGIILSCARLCLAYPLSHRNLGEMMEGRGVEVGHSSICRRVRRFTPPLEAAFRQGKKRPVGKSWRMDETYIQVKGQWKHPCRAVDKEGGAVGFLPAARRDKTAALRFFKRAAGQHGLPGKAMIDKSGANTAALEGLQEETGQKAEIRRIKYLNNPVEQDHRAVKRIVRPMLGFKTFDSARCALRGIERMHRIKKGQMIAGDGKKLSAAGQFYSLAA
jgi:putative transposase